VKKEQFEELDTVADCDACVHILWTDEASLFSVHLRHRIIAGDIVLVRHLIPEDVPLAVRQRSWFGTQEFQHTRHGGLPGCGILWWQEFKKL
jgi:hypothetical protein